jgi:histidinol-phosphate aminotransferase
LALSKIEKLLQVNTESVVVIDEAYVDFGTESAVSLINRYPNLLVTHTLSKARSLAGLRVGYALGNSALIEALIRVKDSFNSYPIDRFASAGAIAAIEDTAYFDKTRQQVIATREELVISLRKLGFEILPSGANFIFAQHPKHDGAKLTAQLREKNIIVRHFKAPTRIAPYMRITIGTDAQSQLLVSALKQIIAL